jgi:type I site-specific restriction-modification system R (restriction) subunit
MARFNDPADPLKIIIVTAKLLTGFDAPILYVQYLDKPLKEHTLVQAIARTNRVYPPNKTHGRNVSRQSPLSLMTWRRHSSSTPRRSPQ